MGLTENETRELESNVIEQLKSSEILAQDPRNEVSTPGNDKMDCEILVTETMEQKEVTATQNMENIVVSTEEMSDRITEMEPNQGEISMNIGAEKQEPPLVSVNNLSVVESMELASQNGLTNHENMGIPLDTSSNDPDNGKLESVQIDATSGSGHLDKEDRAIYGQSRKRKSEVEGRVTSSWSLRSRSQEKPKAPGPNETVKTGSASAEKKRKGTKKKQMKKNTVNEFSRARSHLRYLLHRIKYEQSLIDAYSAEGWKGQSLEKLKPEKELERAKSHILRYKLKIRALFQHLDVSLSVGKLPSSLFDSEGEIDSEDIFCAKCGSKDLSLDNDIILCDGACERGFHQFCLEPPLLKEHIPPGDEGWLCPGCDCKVDCIDMLKDFQGTKISVSDSWEKIFPEAAAAASGKKLDEASGSSSDDAEDDDYDPDKPNKDQNVEGDESSSDESNYFSASEDVAVPHNNEKYQGLPSDDSEDDDFDPSASYEDKQVKQGSSSSDFTSDSEDLDALLEDETMPEKDHGQISSSVDQKQLPTGSKVENSKVGRSLKDELAYLMETGAKPVAGKRHVERLDYLKLLEETYGNSSSDSSDEDFDDGNSSSDSSDEDFDDATAQKRRKTDHEKIEVKSASKTPISKNTDDENQKESKRLSKRARKNVADGGTSESSAKIGSSRGTKRSVNKRLGEAVTQSLYTAFNENQYPEKAAKESLAKELGLTVQQVSKWFENARWSLNHRPRMESNSAEKPPEPQTTIGTDNSPNAQMRVENVVTNESSGTRKIRKRNEKSDRALDDATATRKGDEQNMLVDMQLP